ncbi:MAG: ester cyclase [Longimicrobiales bacterium]|nr:ester cyclase [Longimicrobiales bacterium]
MKGLAAVAVILVAVGVWTFVRTSDNPPPAEMTDAEVISTERADEIGAIYAEARNTPNLDLLDEIYSEDVVVHDYTAPEEILGLETLKAYYRESHAGFPDFKMGIEEVFPAGDRIVFRWRIDATHTGDLRGMPATGKAVTVSGVAIDRIEGGQIVEEWIYFNLLDLLQQLGMQVVPGEPQT